MATIGNSLAFGLLILISIVFFRTRYYLTRASEYYRACLILALITAILNTVRLETVRFGTSPEWVVVGLATVEFLLVIILSSAMTIYLTAKVAEHILTEDKLKFASVYLYVTASVFSLAVIANLFFGYIFSVDTDGNFVNGPLSFLPYLILVPQFALVGIYCVKYRKTLNKKVLFALTESVLVIAFLLIVKLMYDIHVLVLAFSFVQLIFLLDFQRQKMGVNGVTKLNDSRSFFSELEKRKRKDKSFKVYLVWIENIGIIKHNYGHKIGDEVLYRFSHSLEHLFLGSTAFHMHGTNFTLVVNDDSSVDYKKQLLEFLDAGITINDKLFNLEYTVAEHIWHDDEPNSDAFYEKLEHAAAIAKENGINFITYTLDLEIARLRKKYLINRMQSISAEDGFEIWFQPIFSNEKNNFASVEVLLRLKEKDGSYVSPAEFIPIAERTGQITAITWFVIEQTCRTLSENRALDGMRVSINLPMLHLTDPLFENRLNDIVDSYGIPHKRISFEFTERVILEDLGVAEKNMRRLANSGYTFYLDDFGVGYSNFNCVLRLPLETIKLDMTLTATTENHNLVSILTDLFHDMELNVVAEGAETAEQVEMLRTLGVDSIQGYYFAKPMPLDSLIAFLNKNNN